MQDNGDKRDDLLDSVDGAGVPVKSRTPSPEALRRLFDDFANQDDEDAKQRARIRGMVDGNPPWDPDKLREDGQGYRSNFNDRSGTSIINTSVAAQARLVLDVNRLIDIEFLPGRFADEHTAEEIADSIVKAYTFTVKKERRVVFSTLRAIRDTEETGLGFLVFTNKWDWRPKVIKRSHCFFNKKAGVDLEDLREFCIVTTIKLNEAWNIIQNSGASAYAGWNIDALKKALAAYFYDGETGQVEGITPSLQWDWLQDKILANDVWYQERQYREMSIVHGWIAERDRRVSHYIIPFEAPGHAEKYLYANVGESECMSHVVNPIPFNYGEGELGTVKGKGHEIFASVTVAMRKLNVMNDASDLGSSLILEDRGGGEDMEYAFIRRGPVTLINSRSLAPIQQSFNPTMQPALAMRQIMMQNLNNNIGIYRPYSESGDSSEKTAEQVRSENARESRMEADQQFMRFMYYDSFHAEMLRRLVNGPTPDPKDGAYKSYQRFWRICEAYGLTKSMLRDLSKDWTVSAVRSIGSGSPSVRLNSLIRAKQLVGADMDARSRWYWNREVVETLAGAENVNKLMPPSPIDARAGIGASFAQLENNDIEEGSQVLARPGQDHEAHLAMHLSLVAEYVQAYMQDPLSVDMQKFMNVAQQGPGHIMRQAELLAMDPYKKEKAEQYVAELNKYIPAIQQAAREFDKIMQAKAQERERLVKENMKLREQLSDSAVKNKLLAMETQARIEARNADVTNLIDNRTRKQMGQLQQQIQKVQQSMAIKQAEAVQRLQNEQAEMNLKMEKMLRELEMQRKVSE